MNRGRIIGMRSIVNRCAALLSGAFLLMNSVPAAFAEEPNTIVQKEAHTMQTYRPMLTELAPGYPGQRAAADGLR